MAIFKTKYISKFLPTHVKRAKAYKNLHYIVHRKGKNGEDMTRQLFDGDGDTDEERGLFLINNSRFQHIQKIILNFDDLREDTYRDLDLRLITKKVMQDLSKKLGVEFYWIAVMHDDHGNKRRDGKPRRHIHSMAFIDGFIDKQMEIEMIALTTQHALNQRQKLDQFRKSELFQNLMHLQEHSQTPIQTSSEGAGGRSDAFPGLCTRCGDDSLEDGRCRACGAYQGRSLTRSL